MPARKAKPPEDKATVSEKLEEIARHTIIDTEGKPREVKPEVK